VIENSDEKTAKYVQESAPYEYSYKDDENDEVIKGRAARIYRVGPKKDKTTITAGLGTNFDIVRASYELKITDEKDEEKMTDHTIALSAPLSVAYLDTLHVGASVQLRSGKLNERAGTGYGIDLGWQGKNGLRAGVHYTDGYNGKLAARVEEVAVENEKAVTEGATTVVRTADTDYLRKYTYPDGTTHYLGNGLAVTAGWGISF